MVLSKRERYIAIGTAAAVSLLVLDRFVLSPYMTQRDAITAARDAAARQLADAELLFQRQRHLRPIWAEMQKGGLKIDPSQAESQVVNAVLDWTKWSQANLVSLKPERTSQEGKFEVIGFEVTETGTMASVSRLVWALETATIPIRVNELQVTPRKEGTDDLSVRLSVSALCLPPDADKSEKSDNAGGAAQGGGGRS